MAETLAGFRPARRTPDRDGRRSPARTGASRPSRSAPRTTCPASPASTVDGYAVRAADTYGASEGLPSYLDVDRRRRDGPRAARSRSRAGIAVAMPTGGVLPEGADAVVMVEHTQEAMPGTIEVVRPVAPGDGLVRADEDARARRRARCPPAARCARRTSACSRPRA